MPETMLEVTGLSKSFGGRGLRSGSAAVKAVDNVHFTLARGETLGLVGESGCGKTTLSRLVLALLDADAGSIRIGGDDFANATRGRKREMRRRIQIVFQDALSSLNPRMTVGSISPSPCGSRELDLRRFVARKLDGSSHWSACGSKTRTAIPTNFQADNASALP